MKARAMLCTMMLAAAAASAQVLDEGLLQVSWFGPDVQFREAEDVDYLWVAPGLDLKGRTLQVQDWDEPEMLAKKKRDAKDAAKIEALTETMPGMLRGALAASLDGVAEVSRKEGDILVQGRFVDCNAGSKAAKFIVGMGAGSATATWDLKLIDAASGTLLMAVHHRAISGTHMSDIEDKIVKWLEEFGAVMAKGPARVYDAAKPVKK